MGCIWSVCVLFFWLILVGIIGFLIHPVILLALVPLVVIIWLVMTLRKSGDKNAKLQQRLTVEQTRTIVDAIERNGSAN